MEDRGGDVLPGDPVAQQGLNVRLGEHPAAGGDGIKRPALPRQAVDRFKGLVEQNRHLLDEGPGAARAVPVHADVGLKPIVEEGDLGVLAPDLNQGADIRPPLPDQFGGGDDLLNERKTVRLRHTHARGAGEGEIQDAVSQRLAGLRQHFPDRIHRQGMVAAVTRKNDSSL